MIRVGIPRSLAYFKYFPLWQTFFESLGAKVVFSLPTNPLIVEQGIKSVVDEACLPVKVYFGHVQYLKDKVDYIFVPRLVSVERKEFTCPKFLGIPDMLKASIPDLPNLIAPTIDLTKQDKYLWKKVWEVGRLFSSNPLKVSLAWQKGLSELSTYKQTWLEEEIPAQLNIYYKPTYSQSLKVVLLGHEYIIYDQYLSMYLIEKWPN